MGLRFQRRVSILPGVHLNLGLHGASVNFGVPGASFTVGARGVGVNLGLPGTGISWREHVPWSDGEPPHGHRSSGAGRPTSAVSRFEYQPATPISSAPTSTLTSASFASLRALILETRAQRAAANRDLKDCEARVGRIRQDLEALRARRSVAEGRLRAIEKSWFAFRREARLAKAAADRDRAAAAVLRGETLLALAAPQIDAARERRDVLWVDVSVDLPERAEQAWRKLEAAFDALSRCSAIWDITASRAKRAGEGRSAATVEVRRERVSLRRDELDVLETRHAALRWQNANGGDLFLLPGFLAVARSETDFALIDYSELSAQFELSSFSESEAVPSDATRIGSTWTFANRDGSRDMRFSHNSQIPVLAYAEFHWRSVTGLDEAFQFSNFDVASQFATALIEFGEAAYGRTIVKIVGRFARR